MKFLSHESALQFWKFTLAQRVFAEKIARVKQAKYLVLSERDKFNNSIGVSYTCTKRLPADALDHERGVVTPYFMFLQLAKDYDLFELILLACLLCSCEDGPRTAVLLEKQKLVAFVQAAVGHRGRSKALHALRYVNERAVSVMEVFVHMFFALPNNLGGLGLKGGVFNYKVELDAEGKKALQQDYCYIDYCFPDLKIGYEYLGSGHSSTMDFDSARTVALGRMGYKIQNITKTQLYNPYRRLQLFKQVLTMHGKTMRIRTPNFEMALNRLHEILPRIAGTNEASPLANYISHDKRQRWKNSR